METQSTNNYRGYISSRRFRGERAPQHVQNLVIRSYCENNNFKYLLSATELAMPGCFIMLEQLLEEVHRVSGIVCYSLLQLPDNQDLRHGIFSRIICANRSIHFAVEGLSVCDWKDEERVEVVLQTSGMLPHCLSGSELRRLINLGYERHG